MKVSRLVGFGALLFIVACGGSSGGGSTPTPPTTPTPPPPPPPTFSYEGTGIFLSIPVDSDDSLNVVSGEMVSLPVTVSKVEESIPVEITLQQTVSGISLDTTGDSTQLLVDSSLLVPGTDYNVTVVARNTEKDESIDKALIVRTIEPTVIATGTLPATGGTVVSADGSFGVSVDASELTRDFEVEITLAVTPGGIEKFRVRFDPDISSETGMVRIVSQAEGNRFQVNNALSKNQVKTGPARADATSNTILPRPGIFIENRRFASFENSLTAWLPSCNEVVADAGTPPDMCFNVDQEATVLESAKPEVCFALDAMTPLPLGCDETDRGATFQPVIFVHGFRRDGDLGGGSGTWGEFQSIVSELTAPAPGGGTAQVVPFEFRWRTDASFRVVADDLAASIVRVNELTGSPVHIVAHSFGGVLVRTLMVGETYSLAPFDLAQISTVLTLGTPHSGVYKDPTDGPESGVEFPDGQDNWSISFCSAVSCWQMGDKSLSLFLNDTENRLLYDAGNRGEHIDRISTLPIASVPMVVGIGLEREEGLNSRYANGDKLITFSGQRISPSSLLETDSLVTCNQNNLGKITEVVLGPLNEDGRSLGNPGPGGIVPQATPDSTSPLAFGYAHSATSPGTNIFGLNPRDGLEYSEAFVERCADNGEFCQPYAAVEIFKRILSATDPFGQPAYCITPVSPGPPSVSELTASGGSLLDSIELEWTAALGGFAPIEYRVYDATDSAQRVFLNQTVLTTYEILSAPEGEEQCFVVVAVDVSGNTSEESNRACALPTDKSDAAEGWLQFESGDPGVPNDGLSVPGEPCPASSGCGYREFTPTERIRLGPNNSPITISAYEAKFGFFLRFGLAGLPAYCSSSYSDPFGNGDTPPYDGVPGRFLVIDEAGFSNAVDSARNRYPECMAAPPGAGYISRIDVSTGGLGTDGVYLAYGSEVFPDDGLPPIPQTLGWVAFEEGVAGVPDDDILVQGQPHHTIVEEFVLGDADGLTLSVYGTGGEALDDLVIRYSGFPAVCEFNIPLAGQLPNAPSIRGVLGKYISLNRAQFITSTQVVTILQSQNCADVTINDAYYAAFELSGGVNLVDGAFVGIGQNVFPGDSP